ncbi:hypothetical protein [Paenibacillus rhizophilus]|uniref:Uncharacterized protein n=1 Tax=Paenibacillus rhizophilus TaxID=1850366 RepID=A0A3N9Q4V1_9BACL|nr:hypothetical protein [Paenibacillus rhizophilus]RQW13782.1 hypothetical protein EH198_05150 [Paenibacillus rhizophilus]
MIYAVLALALFLMILAGIIASANSRLLRGRERHPAAKPGAVAYSVVGASVCPDNLTEPVPLFRIWSGYETAVEGGTGNEAGEMHSLVRTAVGKGEMTLEHAIDWMLRRMADLAAGGSLLYKSYVENTVHEDERTAILELEQSAEEGARA